MSNLNELFLLKFVENRYCDSFLNGDIHLPSFRVYKEDSPNLTPAQTDVNEGNIYSKLNYNDISSDDFVLTVNNEEILNDDIVNLEIKLDNGVTDDVKNSSYVQLHPNDLYMVNFKEYKLKENSIEELKEIAKDANSPEYRKLIIIRKAELLNRISTYSKLHNLDIRYGKVIYDNGEPESIFKLDNLDDYTRLFHKDSSYKGQREFRIVVSGNIDEIKKDNINIGDISDIAHVLNFNDLYSLKILVGRDN